MEIDRNQWETIEIHTQSKPGRTCNNRVSIRLAQAAPGCPKPPHRRADLYIEIYENQWESIGTNQNITIRNENQQKSHEINENLQESNITNAAQSNSLNKQRK